MIGVLDYGVGNVASIVSMLRRIGADADRVSSPESLPARSSFILPGIGAFDDVVLRFRSSGLLEPLRELVVEDQRPLLGICVGMQMLADMSDEGDEPGLGWVPGHVRHLRTVVDETFRLPAMGWYFTKPAGGHDLVPDMTEPARFYYTHSYFIDPDDPAMVAATVDYGVSVPSGVRNGGISGTQFHPEKSHRFGKALLTQFVGSTA